MRKTLPFLFAVILTAPFWNLGHPLWEIDDARYAEVPREMLESGNWLTPSLNYVDYVEKPPMIYWLSTISYTLFGVSEAASRVPLALLAVLGLLGVWWLGCWLYSPVVGLQGGILLGSCVQFFALSHLTTPDMAVSVSLLWATTLILRCLRRPKDRWAGALAWIAMAAAFLSKGLISIVFPGAWTLMLIFFFPGLRKGVRPLLLNWGLPVFVFIVGGWFLAMERANPGFFHVFIIEQHFQRFLDTQKYNRPGPWYYFVIVDLVGTLPWTPLFILGTLTPLWRWNRSDARDRQLALWVVLIFSFFSVSSSKLITYILPLFAHQALLGARFMERLRSNGGAYRQVKAFAVLLCALFAAAGLVALAVLPSLHLPMELPRGLKVAGIALLAVVSLSQFLLAHAHREGGAARPMPANTLLALAIFVLMSIGSDLLTDEISVRNLSQGINGKIAQLSPGTEVRLLAYNKYLHGVPFYTGRPVDVINWVGELHYAKRFQRFQHRFGDDHTIGALPHPDRRTLVTVQNRDMAHFKNIAPMGKARSLTTYGPWTLAEF